MGRDELIARINELLGQAVSENRNLQTLTYIFQGTLSLSTALYGAQSNQVQTLREQAAPALSGPNAGNTYPMQKLLLALRGVLLNLRTEIAMGLATTIQRQTAGAVLAEFLALARAVLDQSGENGKNVAGVLVAAAYEDVMRRMGAELANVTGPVKLDDVLEKLKDAKVLVGPELVTGKSYLTFRNKALHAEWDKVTLPVVESAMGYVEQLLLKHFR